MGLDRTVSSAKQIRHAPRRSAALRQAEDGQRHPVLGAFRVPVADAAAGFRPLADGSPLLSPLATGWHVVQNSRRPPPASACRGWPTTDPLRGDHRQPVGEDRGKRGDRGYDAGKKIKGRKRHIVVDVLGLILAVVVHAANIQDRDGAKLVLGKLRRRFPRLKLIWADGGYAGKLVDWAARVGGWTLEIVKRLGDVTGFVILPKRWIVERTFSWFGRYRRLSKDYETLTQSSESMIYWSMTHLMLRRLRPCAIQ